MELSSSAIKVRGLTFAYNNVPVLDNVNIDIEAGKITMILGRNGSGKSTFLRILAGLLPYRTGKVEIHGSDQAAMKYNQRARLVGFLNQQHKAVFPFTVGEVVLTGRAGYVKFQPGKNDRIAVTEAIKRTGIEHLTHRHYTELSGGEQQLVMIARVLAQNPAILLLDEPTAHLDLNFQKQLLQLLRALTKEGLTVIGVFHDPNLAFLNGDDFLFLKDKQVVRPPASVNAWDKNFLESVYEVDLEVTNHKDRAVIFTSNN